MLIETSAMLTTASPMKQASTNTVKWARKAAGALAPMNQNSAAAIRKVIAVALAEAGALASPCPLGAGGGAAGFFAAGAAAGSFGAGGGHVMLPSLITVRPRMAS